LRELDLRDRRVLVAAGLLHDIGHGPLSHTLEPIFRLKFGINHHRAGHEILVGNSPLGDEIAAIMRNFHVSLDEVIAMIEGEHDSPYAYLFSSPINLDTIEGITRTSLFSGINGANFHAERLVELLATSGQWPVRQIDAFWALKHRAYNLFIHTREGLLYDGLAQAYMSREIDHFAPRDFLKTEPQLRHKEPALFHLFAWARASRRRVHQRFTHRFKDLLDYEIEAPVRSFSVKVDIELARPEDLWLRYTQTKTKRRQSINDLLV